MTATAKTMTAAPRRLAGFAALVLGAVAMGISPVFARYADVGPFASAFWRVALALPVLWLWMGLEAGTGRDLRGPAAA